MAYQFVPQFIKMLNNLGGLLQKAQAHADAKKFDPQVLLNAYLAPDQFNFTRQVQVTCDMAKYYCLRLTDKEAPKQEDTEKTFPELDARIQKTIAYLKTIKADDFKGWEERKTTNPRREGKYLPGKEFALEHAIPNFFFHLTTAYSILRNNGVDIGKKDYLGDINWRDLK